MSSESRIKTNHNASKYFGRRKRIQGIKFQDNDDFSFETNYRANQSNMLISSINAKREHSLSNSRYTINKVSSLDQVSKETSKPNHSDYENSFQNEVSAKMYSTSQDFFKKISKVPKDVHLRPKSKLVVHSDSKNYRKSLSNFVSKKVVKHEASTPFLILLFSKRT